jgi:hypothetical protein
MSKFKGPNGSYLTQGLFYEWNNQDAPFTLRDTGQEEYYTARSGKKYRSLAYVFRNSVSEYDCAIKTLGSWEHWQELKRRTKGWFETGMVNGVKYSGLNDWIAEKEMSDESAAKAVLMKAVEDGDVNAAKFVYDKKTKSAKGRPEKKQAKPKPSSVVSIAKGIKHGS